jgi:transposase InsO family protein
MQFVSRLARGERMSDLCAEYEISRKTGHKIWNRYQQLGVAGLEDQSRRPRTSPKRMPPELVEILVATRKQHPTWGPKKLKSVLETELGHEMPAASSIGTMLKRQGLATQRRPRRCYGPSRPTGLRDAKAPNDVWCADYKGQFRLGDQSYCYPLTVSDQHSRYLLACEGMGAISDAAAREVFADVFKAHGLPESIRTDNGAPFVSTGLGGLTKLSAYWLSLGIEHERTRPAHPEDNGRHERMHRTLKQETARPSRHNLLQQQERFDGFVVEYNERRPHEALEMKTPAGVYASSSRPCPSPLPLPAYPLHDDAVVVSSSGGIRLPRRGFVHISSALAGYPVGIREELDGRWLVSFARIDLGHVDHTGQIQPITLKSPQQ